MIYSVTARRSGGWWALEVPDVPGAYSQVRRLDQAAEAARDAIAARLDVVPNSFEVQVEPALDDEARQVLDAVNQAKTRLLAAQQAAADATRRAAVVLARHGNLSMRDAGQVMHLSHQRVAQLLEENDRLGV